METKACCIDPAERRRGKLRLYYTPMSPSVEPDAASQAPVSVHYDTRPIRLSFWRRLQVPFIAAAVYGAIRTLGPTLRFYALRLHEVGMITSSPQKLIAQGTDWRFLTALKKEMKG